MCNFRGRGTETVKRNFKTPQPKKVTFLQMENVRKLSELNTFKFLHRKWCSNCRNTGVYDSFNAAAFLPIFPINHAFIL